MIMLCANLPKYKKTTALECARWQMRIKTASADENIIDRRLFYPESNLTKIGSDTTLWFRCFFKLKSYLLNGAICTT